MVDSLTDKPTVVPPAFAMPKKIRLPFTCFLALRYLKPKRTFLSLITLISILGVVLGISVLIIVISVMTGFERELQRKIIGFDADITIAGNEVMNDWRSILDRTKKTKGWLQPRRSPKGESSYNFRIIGRFHGCGESIPTSSSLLRI